MRFQTLIWYEADGAKVYISKPRVYYPTPYRTWTPTRITITPQQMAGAEPGVFVRAMQQDLAFAYQGLLRDLNRRLYADGAGLAVQEVPSPILDESYDEE